MLVKWFTKGNHFARMNTVPIKRLKQVLRLDEQSGKLYWKVNSRRLKAGQEAGGIRYLGNYRRPYWCLSVDKTRFRRGRVVYAMTRGFWPSNQIDHWNRDSLDDRPENLRDVTSLENNANRKHRGQNGFKFHPQYLVFKGSVI